MTKDIHLVPNQVPTQLLGSYRGKKLKASIAASVTIPSDAGTWDGGSREIYRAVRLADGAEVPLHDRSAPWAPGRRDQTFPMQPGIVVIRHSMFCGKDAGLTFMVHEADAVKLLPSPAAAITATEKAVLELTGGLKPAYRDQERARRGISVPDFEAAKASLVEKGMLTRAGAITVKGRNARAA